MTSTLSGREDRHLQGWLEYPWVPDFGMLASGWYSGWVIAACELLEGWKVGLVIEGNDDVFKAVAVFSTPDDVGVAVKLSKDEVSIGLKCRRLFLSMHTPSPESLSSWWLRQRCLWFWLRSRRCNDRFWGSPPGANPAAALLFNRQERLSQSSSNSVTAGSPRSSIPP